MKVVTGYKLEGDTDLIKIDELTKKLKSKIKRIAIKRYHSLLGSEIAFIVDSVALGIMAEPIDETIYDMALKQVNERISLSTGQGIKDDMSVYAFIMPYKDNTYFRVTGNGDLYEKSFKSLLIPFHIDEIEASDNNNAKTEVWNELFNLYKDSDPLVINLSYIPTEADVNIDAIIFPDKMDRCRTQARYSIMNEFLMKEALGQQIPPQLLMRYMSGALEEMTSSEGVKLEREKVAKLGAILPEITHKSKFIFGDLIDDNTESEDVIDVCEYSEKEN